MYAPCVWCTAPLGRNTVIEALQVGRRLAFDECGGTTLQRAVPSRPASTWQQMVETLRNWYTVAFRRPGLIRPRSLTVRRFIGTEGAHDNEVLFRVVAERMAADSLDLPLAVVSNVLFKKP